MSSIMDNLNVFNMPVSARIMLYLWYQMYHIYHKYQMYHIGEMDDR